MSITRAFADSSVERVFLQSSLYSDSVTHRMSSVSPPRSIIEARFRKAGIRASSSGSVGRHGEHFATLGLSAAASKQEIKQAYRKLALVVGYSFPNSICFSFVSAHSPSPFIARNQEYRIG